MPDTPAPPPEAQVIRTAREAAGMTAQAAAEATEGISATYWRDVERGYGGRRGKRVPVRASARTLAAMARTTGTPPARLTGAGREDAARVLDEILRRAQPGAQVIQHPASAVPRDDGELIPMDPAQEARLRPYIDQVYRELLDAVAATGLTDPPGGQVFRDVGEATAWDHFRKSQPREYRVLLLARARAAEAEGTTENPRRRAHRD